MEGKYFYVEDHFALNPHIHVIFTLDNGSQLLYQDTRKFGTYHLYDKAHRFRDRLAPFQVLGLEPFSKEFTSSYMKQKIKNKKKPIKSLLLDQTVWFVDLGIFMSMKCYYSVDYIL